MSDNAKSKGDAFFDRADKVAETGNWDYAIDLYLDGLARDPNNVERGHKAIRAAAMNRAKQGGKGLGMLEKMKLRSAKTPEDRFNNAMKVLAKEPGAMDQMLVGAKAANALGHTDAALFLLGLLLKGQKSVKKPSMNLLIAGTELYQKMEEYGLASEMAQFGKSVDKDNVPINELLRECSAKFAIKQGKYDKGKEEKGEFTDNVRDLKGQMDLVQQDADVKSEAYLKKMVEEARAEYLAAPDTPGKINAYIDALLKFEDDAHENQAIGELQEIFKRTGTYRYKMRIGDIRIRQMTRQWRELRADNKAEEANQAARKLLAFKLEEFHERVVNYPTDLALKFELGQIQYQAGQYDDAIATLQAAQNDPRRRLRALAMLGQAFDKKGLVQEAVKTFQRALEGDLRDEAEKELRYALGNALVKINRFEEASDEFSKVAQMDYTFKDVREKLDAIRKKLAGNEG
jgi:hypothetical protein